MALSTKEWLLSRKFFCKAAASTFSVALFFVQIMSVWDLSKHQCSASSPVPEVGAMFNKSAWMVEVALLIQLPLGEYIMGRGLDFTSVVKGGRRGS